MSLIVAFLYVAMMLTVGTWSYNQKVWKEEVGRRTLS
jgi:hypothetical protein